MGRLGDPGSILLPRSLPSNGVAGRRASHEKVVTCQSYCNFLRENLNGGSGAVKGGSSNVGPALEAPPKPAPVPGADPKQLQALKEKVAALTQQVTELKGELALAQADIKAAQATARSEGIESVRAELAAALMEAKNEYKAGLQDGARLATGKKFALNRSCASSSAASSKSKRRTERAEESSESD